MVGLAVRDLLGFMVGLLTGLAVGYAVRLLVGLSVVGVTVGLAVGLAVGLSVAVGWTGWTGWTGTAEPTPIGPPIAVPRATQTTHSVSKECAPASNCMFAAFFLSDWR